MKRLVPILALAILALAANLALGQDDVMTLNSQGLGSHDRPLVVFTHEQHAANIQCINCHHDFDDYYNNTGSEGIACSECHTPSPTAKNRVSLMNAFHKQCKDCHQTFLQGNKDTGPVMCGGCHVREAKTVAKK